MGKSKPFDFGASGENETLAADGTLELARSEKDMDTNTNTASLALG